MRKTLFAGIVALGALAAAHAQTPTAGAAREAPPAKVDAEQIRADLEAARKRLDEAARDVAQLSQQLGRGEVGDVFFFDAGGPKRAVLGLQLDAQGGRQGARVMGVSPGGAAAEAGVLVGDVIVNIDGKQVAGRDEPSRAVIEHMRTVEPDQKVKLKVLRDGKSKDFTVVARPMAAFAGTRMFGAPAPAVGGPFVTPLPAMRTHAFGWAREFGGLELASLTPRLGAYFGATEGVLVVKAPDNATYKLEDGDVIQSIDGRKPEDGAHALRILRSYRPGEKLALSILRQRKTMRLDVTMPDRPEFEHAIPVMPPGPPAPPVTPAPPPPGSGSGAAD